MVPAAIPLMLAAAMGVPTHLGGLQSLVRIPIKQAPQEC